MAYSSVFPDRVKLERAIGDSINPAAYLDSLSLAHSFVGEGDSVDTPAHTLHSEAHSI
jgi:hypothetical protein